MDRRGDSCGEVEVDRVRLYLIISHPNNITKKRQCFTLYDTAPSKGEGIPEHLQLVS